MDPIPTTVPEGFRYETRYVVLSYLALPPALRSLSIHSTAAEGGDARSVEERDKEKERNTRIKTEIDAELTLLEEEIAASSSVTGFDRMSSAVFSPAHGDSSVEDSLAVLGDRVAQELDPLLSSVTHSLLSGPLDYEGFRGAVQEVCIHTQEGWSQVLVPLVLLQRLQDEGQSLATVLSLGTRFLEEAQADFIIQQGGWGAVFSLEESEDPGVIIAEDSNDIYILSGEQHPPDHLSPPASLLATAEGSGPASWQTESLAASLVSGHESWAQVGMMDPEDGKSLDSNEGVAALAEERSENNSSNSDIVHVEREDAELGEGEELQESMMSVLGTESDLAALRAEYKEDEDDAIPSHTALIPDAPQALVVLEEPVVLEAPASLSAVPPLLVPADMEPAPEPVPESKPEPPAPVPEPQPEAPSEAPSMASAVESPRPPSPIKEPTAPPAPEPQPEPASEPELEPVVVPEPVPIQEPPVAQLEVPEAAAAPILETPVPPPAEALLQSPEPAPAPAAEPEPEPEPEPKPESSELPVLLYGGAALVVMAAVAAYGALAYRRK